MESQKLDLAGPYLVYLYPPSPASPFLNIYPVIGPVKEADGRKRESGFEDEAVEMGAIFEEGSTGRGGRESGSTPVVSTASASAAASFSAASLCNL